MTYRNLAKCRICEEILHSKSHYDFVSCKCYKESHGKEGIWLDGGNGPIIRRGGRPEDFIEVDNDISILGCDWFETYVEKDNKNNILVRPKWIKCSDRLPGHNQHVIMYCRTFHNQEWHVEPGLFEPTGSGNREWAYLFAYNEGYSFTYEVSHWMPLPKPPDTNL